MFGGAYLSVVMTLACPLINLAERPEPVSMSHNSRPLSKDGNFISAHTRNCRNPRHEVVQVHRGLFDGRGSGRNVNSFEDVSLKGRIPEPSNNFSLPRRTKTNSLACKTCRTGQPGYSHGSLPTTAPTNHEGIYQRFGWCG